MGVFAIFSGRPEYLLKLSQLNFILLSLFIINFSLHDCTH